MMQVILREGKVIVVCGGNIIVAPCTPEGANRWRAVLRDWELHIYRRRVGLDDEEIEEVYIMRFPVEEMEQAS